MIDRSPPAVTEAELHAYVDGELPTDRRLAVETWLASHPDDRARVDAWRRQADDIRAHFGAADGEAVPQRFDIDQLARPERPWKKIAAAAALAAFIMGGAGGWLARDMVLAEENATPGFEAFTADAVEAYKVYVVEVRHPVEVTAADSAHLVDWLSRRVGYRINAPNLEKLGLKLVGGRLLPGPTGPAAFFMYENASGERFTLYCGRSNAPASSLRYAEGGPANAVYWVNDEVAYVISGKSGREQLHNVAVAAYEQLDDSRQKGG